MLQSFLPDLLGVVGGGGGGGLSQQLIRNLDICIIIFARRRRLLSFDVMSSSKLPKALVFDLDGCLWYPEMFMIQHTGGPPFVHDDKDGSMKTSTGERVELLGDTADIMREIATDHRWKHAQVSVASRCDEPKWAMELIDTWPLGEGGPLLKDALRGPREIYKANKADQLRTIARKTVVDLADTVFFDNEPGNCRDVAGAGATVCFVPNGMTRKAFQEVLDRFPAPGTIVGKDKG